MTPSRRAELDEYASKEFALQRTLKKLIRWRARAAHTPVQVRRKRRWVFRLSKQFLAQAHPARMAVVHSVLPANGREVTRRFSELRVDAAPPPRKAKFCAACNPEGSVWPEYDDSSDDSDVFDSEDSEGECHVALPRGSNRRLLLQLSWYCCSAPCCSAPCCSAPC